MNDRLDMWEFVVRVQRTPDGPEAWLFHTVCQEGVIIRRGSVDLDRVVAMASEHRCREGKP